MCDSALRAFSVLPFLAAPSAFIWCPMSVPGSMWPMVRSAVPRILSPIVGTWVLFWEMAPWVLEVIVCVVRLVVVLVSVCVCAYVYVRLCRFVWRTTRASSFYVILRPVDTRQLTQHFCMTSQSEKNIKNIPYTILASSNAATHHSSLLGICAAAILMTLRHPLRVGQVHH
ncbi:hypothetical protein DFJ77DRAFT_450050 [Powellomyces hirtus]|nr:hypothetical protein DFJ77DRAFT_450050 [Powellomyces hirtus]